MNVKIFWLVDGSIRLGVMPRPRGGDWLDDEVTSLRESNVDVVVSLLEPAEIVELDLGREELICREKGIGYLSFPIRDYGVPVSRTDAQKLSGELADLLRAGKSVVVHCRQGIGRSSIIAALVLGAIGYAAHDAFELIVQARGRPVPDTDEQRIWVENILDGR